MSEPVVIAPGGGEVIGDASDRRVEILCDDEALAATWSRFGPGRDGAGLHVHRHHTDVFYVLEGELTVKLGPEGDEVTAPAGTVARVPPLVVHGFRNGGDRELRYLNFHAPGMRFAEYMRGLRDGRSFAYDQEPPPADGGRPASEAAIGEPPVAVEELAISDSLSEGGAGRVHALYVLEGELALTVGERELRAGAGSWVRLPPGAPLAQARSGPVRFLDVRAPR